MYIVKSCFTKDHIHIRKTLRIGSLNEYRRTYEKQIADKEEGTVLFNFDIQDLLIHHAFFNFLHTYHGSYGTDHIEKLEVSNGSISNPMHVAVDKYKATKSLHYKNKFIYCFSLLKNPRDANRIFSEYDSKWYINANNIDKVLNIMSDQIFKEVKIRLKNGEKIFNEEVDADMLRIVPKAQSITYTERVLNIDNIKIINNAKQIISMMKEAHFVKTKTFKNEKEIRFAFDFYLNDIILEPVINSIIISAEDIMPLVKN